LLVGLSVASLVGALLVAMASTALIRGLIRDRSIERIRSETALLADWAEHGLQPDTQEFAVLAARRLNLRVTLIDAAGTVVGDSSRDATGLTVMDNHADRPELAAARLRGEGQSFRTSDTTHVEYFYSAALVSGNGAVRYVRVALPSSEVHSVQWRNAWLVVAMVPTAMLLTSALGYAAVRRLSRPVERLAEAVERSAQGDLALVPAANAGEEIERLAEAVRQMQRALLEKLNELGAERALLSSVIEGMREGLLLVGADGQVRLANRPARETLELAFDPEGQPITKVVRHPEALRHVETALAEGVEIPETILRLPTGRSFQLRVAPLDRSGDGTVEAVILMFFDVTRLEKLESVRRDFVGNVSHELRTPLTSIKAFVETLQEGGLDDKANSERFLGIIRKHADRMGDLIEDLTDLSLIETGAISLQVREIPAAPLIRGVAEQLQPLAERRDVTVEIAVGDPFSVRADRRRLEQMITNLLDNAIKFSNPGGRVTARGTTNAEYAVLAFEDDGVGIAVEGLDRVFNRFYQENRDESREQGGTGLGLSIVKHLMRLHGGRVRVESELGAGSVFFLEFPRDPATR
jgi:two-component system phosphate regulon sensor histidine kinase PhoR